MVEETLRGLACGVYLMIRLAIAKARRSYSAD